MGSNPIPSAIQCESRRMGLWVRPDGRPCGRISFPPSFITFRPKRMKSTNYYDTFIQVAEDCPVSCGQIPPLKGDKETVANIQFALIKQSPYKFTSDEILFDVHIKRIGITKNEIVSTKARFFSKGQACLRSSPLTKRYGWGVHSNGEGKVAIIAVETDEYKRLSKDAKIRQLKALRSKRV